MSNIEPSTYKSKVYLTNHRGDKLETKIEIAPYSTMMAPVPELFSKVGEFLEDRLGTLRFENWSHQRWTISSRTIEPAIHGT